MKKRVVFLLILCAAALLFWRSNRIVGTVSGAEHEYITVNGITYERDISTEYGYNGRGLCLGRVTNGDVHMKVYAVRGDTARQYLYVRGEWEGAVYQRAKPQPLPSSGANSP